MPGLAATGTLPAVDHPHPAHPATAEPWAADGERRPTRERLLPEEVPVAMSYNRLSHAVLLATPDDLEDFALGFSLTEGVLAAPGELEELEVVPVPGGIELRMWIAPGRMEVLERRRRRIAGPTGCGLCGLESLAEAVRPVPLVGRGRAWPASALARAVASIEGVQSLGRATRAAHAAAFCGPDAPPVLREDVGRHNALDKLAGALARSGADAASGVLVLTSRVSVELVQKAAAIGVPVMVAVSVPTALAVRTAEAAGITLAGVARRDGFEVFTHPWRVERG